MKERYHVTQRDDGRWDAKLENAGKPSKTCDTQQEAIEYARRYLAGKDDGGIILVHGAYTTEESIPGRINRVVR